MRSGPGCVDLSKVNKVDDQMYSITIETDEEGVLTIKLSDSAALTKISIEGSSVEFEADGNGKHSTKSTVAAGSHTIIVAFLFRNNDGSIDSIWEAQKWKTQPLLKTFYVADKNYCEEGSCADFYKVHRVDNQMYSITIETAEEGTLTIEMVDPSALVKVSLEGLDIEFLDGINGKHPTKTMVPAGIHTLNVAYLYRNSDGTIDNMWEDNKWKMQPLIKTFYVGDKDYCAG